MPGIHFASSPEISDDSFESSLRALQHDAAYDYRILSKTVSSRLGLTAYPQYPLKTSEDDRLLVVLEGRIYRQGQHAEDSLLDMAHMLVEADKARVGSWLRQQDGDFVLVAYDKARHTWLFLNDALGRLPVYWFSDGESLLISREIRFIVSMLTNPSLDRIGVAQYLAFGYPLGERSLIREVRRVPAGTVFKWDEGSRVCVQNTADPFCFDSIGSSIDARDCTEWLLQSFIKGCKRRDVSSGVNVISLSGGLDSRATAAALSVIGSRPLAYSFERYDNSAASDVRYAEQTAGALDIPWTKVSLPHPSAEDMARILRLRGGMNYVGSSEFLPFMDRIEREHGRNLVYWSGDGGDKTLPDLTSGFVFADETDLTKSIIRSQSIMPLTVACAIAKVQEADVIGEIAGLVGSYPEQSLPDKLVHFHIYERGMKWLFEGEDANRCHFWCCTPFYSLPFFEEAMRLPQSMKRNHALYRNFLNRLSPEISAIPDALEKVPVRSVRFGFRKRGRDWIRRHPALAGTITGLLRKSNQSAGQSVYDKALLGLTTASSPVTTELDLDAADSFCRGKDRGPDESMANLLTVILAGHCYGIGDRSFESVCNLISRRV